MWIEFRGKALFDRTCVSIDGFKYAGGSVGHEAKEQERPTLKRHKVLPNH